MELSNKKECKVTRTKSVVPTSKESLQVKSKRKVREPAKTNLLSYARNKKEMCNKSAVAVTDPVKRLIRIINAPPHLQ